MLDSVSDQQQRQLILIGKIAIFLLLSYAIYYQIVVKHDFPLLYEEFVDKLSTGWIYLILAIALMPMNWILESKKWESLVNKFQPLTKGQALNSIFSGVCVAIITPARVGEYAGRLIHIEKGNRPRALAATFMGSISQNVVNVAFGSIALILLQYRYQLFPWDAVWMTVLLVFAASVGLILLLLKYNVLIRFVASLLPEKWVTNIKAIIKDAQQLYLHEVTFLLSVSSLRYVVYVMQYVLLILFFGVTGDVLGSILAIGVVYLFQTMIPLPPALSIFARGEIAIVIWSIFSSNVLGILAATLCLWVINLLIPALIGYYQIWKLKRV